MIRCSQFSELHEALSNHRTSGKKVGFVPTMGFLHEGHLQLVKESTQANDMTVMSIFVNPTQFGPNEDFDSYPRDEERDAALAEAAGVDILFLPTIQEMYPHATPIQLSPGRLGESLCGARRPGHFNGVLQVVLKLFNLVQPTDAYFGLKDAQQLAIIETFVQDYHVPVTIHRVPIIREEDGLAKSSRNVYLSKQERYEAPFIQQALQKVQQTWLATYSVEQVQQEFYTQIEQHTSGRVDYIEVYQYPDLQRADKNTQVVLIACAVQFSQARLLDNVLIEQVMK